MDNSETQATLGTRNWKKTNTKQKIYNLHRFASTWKYHNHKTKWQHKHGPYNNRLSESS